MERTIGESLGEVFSHKQTACHNCLQTEHNVLLPIVYADLDECLNGQLEERAVCGDDKRCANTEGSFECVDACASGYQPDATDPIGPCLDVDECFISNHNCTLAEKYWQKTYCRKFDRLNVMFSGVSTRRERIDVNSYDPFYKR